MLTWNIGPCSRRSRALEETDRPDTPEESLSRIYEFWGFLNAGLGGYHAILNTIKEASRNWQDHQIITFLELRCGRGDLSAAIVRWARKKKIEVRIFAIDDCPSVISLARDYHDNYREITFENRLISDSRFLEAQQFDYVISASALHSADSTQVARLLKIANLLAKRGIVFSDWMRDIRAWLWMQVLSRSFGDDVVRHDALLSIRKGFTRSEMTKFAQDSGLDYAQFRMHLGYRFSLSGERGLVLSPEVSPIAGLAGA